MTAVPTVNVNSFGGFRTGFQFEATINAMHRAACCGGVAHLTAPHLFRSKQAPPTCFDFRHLPRVAEQPCAPTAGSSSSFFLNGVKKWCPSDFYYLRPATLAAIEYAAIHPLRCPPASEGALVAHVRSGDQFRPPSKPGEAPVHAAYAQPPLAYYLDAWRASGQPSLVVVAEDDANPVVRLLRLLSRSVGAAHHSGHGRADGGHHPHHDPSGGASSSRRLLDSTFESGSSRRNKSEVARAIRLEVNNSFETDLRTVLCATHLATPVSSLQTLFATSLRLRQLYLPRAPGHDLWLGSCQTEAYVATDVHRPGGNNGWANSVQQQLELLLSHNDARVHFRRVSSPPHCLVNASAG